MSDLPSYHSKKDIPGDFSVVESSDKDEKGRRKIKIKIRKKMRTKTRVKTRDKSKKVKSQSIKILQVFLLILAVGALFYAGFQILISDAKRPIVIKKVVQPKSK